jgi:hypothetical protein
MFGLWYSIIGLIFGALCSFNAKEKNRARKEWFTLGFIFSVLALGLIYMLPNRKNENANGDYELSNADEISSLSVNI